MTTPTPAQPGSADDRFGGHEFAYESHTDLFRCIRCHRCEVTVLDRATGTAEPCTGHAPEGAEPLKVNAW
jgi:hypothetical protein